MNIYEKNEKILKNQISKLYLKQTLFYRGIDIKLYKASVDKYSKVYGVESGERTELFEEIRGLIFSDTFEVADKYNVGMFEEGWLITPENDKVNTGDLLSILRVDDKQFYYKVGSKLVIGLTTEVMCKWRLSSYNGPKID